jgi:hypothetical protein
MASIHVLYCKSACITSKIVITPVTTIVGAILGIIMAYHRVLVMDGPAAPAVIKLSLVFLVVAVMEIVLMDAF